jgi:hypothetical protein
MIQAARSRSKKSRNYNDQPSKKEEQKAKRGIEPIIAS